jgi:hypothetical protein
MGDPGLDYVRQMRTQGYTPEQIRGALWDGGYATAEINRLMQVVETPLETTQTSYTPKPYYQENIVPQVQPPSRPVPIAATTPPRQTGLGALPSAPKRIVINSLPILIAIAAVVLLALLIAAVFFIESLPPSIANQLPVTPQNNSQPAAQERAVEAIDNHSAAGGAVGVTLPPPPPINPAPATPNTTTSQPLPSPRPPTQLTDTVKRESMNLEYHPEVSEGLEICPDLECVLLAVSDCVPVAYLELEERSNAQTITETEHLIEVDGDDEDGNCVIYFDTLAARVSYTDEYVQLLRSEGLSAAEVEQREAQANEKASAVMELDGTCWLPYETAYDIFRRWNGFGLLPSILREEMCYGALFE